MRIAEQATGQGNYRAITLSVERRARAGHLTPCAWSIGCATEAEIDGVRRTSNRAVNAPRWMLGCALAATACAAPPTPPIPRPAPDAPRAAEPTTARAAGAARTLATGALHSCALRADRSVVCWGDNMSGQLGDGTTAERWAPVPVVDVDRVVEIAAGGATTCARTADGSAWCWGRMGSVRAPWIRPRRMDAGGTVARLAVGAEVVCVLLVDRRVRCADGRTAGALAPVPGLRAVDLGAGARHACALDADGAVWCWGHDDRGQLGGGRPSGDGRAARIPGLTDVVRLDVLPAGALAHTRDGRAVRWGHAPTSEDDAAVTAPVDVDDPWLAGARATSGRCAIGAAGTLRCAAAWDRPERAAVPLPSPAVEVASAWQHTCARLDDGAVLCFGDNGHGQLGRGDAAGGVAAPTLVPGLDDAEQLVAGELTACARRRSGGVACWSKRLPTGSRLPLPMGDLPGLDGATELLAGSQYACAVGPRGRTRCWGLINFRECLWDSPDNCQSERWEVPREVPGPADMPGAVELRGTCARMSTGRVRCIAPFDGGPPVELPGVEAVQLGGTSHLTCVRHADGGASCAAPTPGRPLALGRVAGIAGAVDLSASRTHVCAALEDGSVACTEPAQARYGVRVFERAAPVAGVTDAVSVAVGDFFACARHRDGGVSCWGRGEHGVLGNGTTHDAPRPMRVEALADAVELVAHDHYACARRSDGRVSCWGRILAGVEEDPDPSAPRGL